MEHFREVRVTIDPTGKPQVAVASVVRNAHLDAEQVEVEVSHVGLGRSDLQMLACSSAPLASPMVPGSDFAGMVLRSTSVRWAVGDRVVATGWGLARSHSGGMTELATVPADWLQRQPALMSAWEAAAVGTPGLCAMYGVLALEAAGVLPEGGPVLVTGSTGGVGSFAVSALRTMGYVALASTGQPAAHSYLQGIGASQVLPRLDAHAAQWLPTLAGVIDCVGGRTLAAAMSAVRHGGVVIACGDLTGALAQVSLQALTTNALSIIGIDALRTGRSRRTEAWQRWEESIDRRHLAQIVRMVSLDSAIAAARAQALAPTPGRMVVRMGRRASADSATLH